jgi:ABC-type lipoprotein export system ATPase subunit
MCKIELKNIDKVYTTGKVRYHALKKINLTISNGGVTAIVGPSGSGKSTILNMITGIDRPTSGSVVVDGTRIDTLDGAGGTSGSSSSSSS